MQLALLSLHGRSPDSAGAHSHGRSAEKSAWHLKPPTVLLGRAVPRPQELACASIRPIRIGENSLSALADRQRLLETFDSRTPVRIPARLEPQPRASIPTPH